MFPILVGFLLGTIEMSIAFYSRQQLLLASREGARVAARHGSVDEVREAVHRVLGDGPLGQAVLNEPDGLILTAIPEDPPNGREAVQVCLKVATTQVVPNLLPWLIDFEGEELTACVIMSLE